MLLTITEFIGRFHPVVVHLPIGILLVGLLLQWLSRRPRYNVSDEVVKIVLLCGAFSAVVACITGFLLSGEGDYDGAAVAWHMWMGIGVAAASLLLIARVVKGQYDTVRRLTSFSLFMLIVVTGHMGGSLTHGADYLTAALYSTADTVAVAKPIANIQEALVYDEVVKPVLQTKCYTCHSAQKQKGGLRMDNPEHLLKGGKNGEIIVQGRAGESEMIKRLLLPPEDEKHMPPKAKPQLNERQVALLHWWIENGADFSKKVKDLPQPEKLQPVLLALESKSHTPKAPPPVPEGNVEPADAKALAALREAGAVVLPVAQGSHFLMANFVTARGWNDDKMKLLLPLRKQLVWLKLGDTKITDAAMSVVGECTRLTILHLHNTGVTDAGMQHLSALTGLQRLNLVDTKVTAAGLEKLSMLKNLQTVYAYRTGVKQEDTGRLKAALPSVEVETGANALTLLPRDTLANPAVSAIVN